ncbi:hypothetical protein BD770DRAFT_390771 [Pilaira anomala]|nr:hypothetical protein BD770DRAFT_390771 [Pilaira anomala]
MIKLLCVHFILSSFFFLNLSYVLRIKGRGRGFVPFLSLLFKKWIILPILLQLLRKKVKMNKKDFRLVNG